ncbi:transcription initiation factor TFIID subunit 4 isoform X5 [Helicoverpa armigera]|uniref:transcription initiation factor TFIID subunit 4 isoform X5 n=1 Tax=Helicoverpa armigera TaxID=29058 RepID=UPI002111182F|nr:transcription initiation factor TFIID subunit 4 isoform X5 [Helicoverpa armigera]
MASAEFLEQALSTNVDENAVNAIVGSLENQLVTPVPSQSSHTSFVNVIPSQNCNITSNAGSIISGQKYVTDQINSGGIVNSIHSNIVSNSSASFNNVQASTQPTFTSLSLSGGAPLSNETLKVIYSQAQHLSNPHSSVTLPVQSLASGPSQSQILHAVSTGGVLPQQGNKTIAMQPPLVIKQGTNTGQVGMQPGMVTVPMTVNSSMPASIPNVMTLNKPGGQNVVVTTQNLGSAQPTIIPNVQILNMRPGAPAVAAQKSVATVSPRVVIGTPQVVGTRATAPHPGVATVSTSVAAPGPIPGQMPAPPIAAPVVASAPSVTVSTTPPQQPSTTTHIKPSDNTKEKCRNFLANLLDLSSKEPPSVEMNVRNLIQELIDAQVEPEEFCDRLERLLNASPQPCLIGFLKKSLPLLRQSLVTKELVIEGINPPAPHVAFSTIPAPTQPVIATSNIQMPRDEDSSSPTLTPLLPPVLPLTLASPLVTSTKSLNVVPAPSTSTSAQKPTQKPGGSIAVLQNIPLHTKINVNKVGKAMTVNSKANFPRSSVPSAALSTVLTPGKSLLKDKEKKSSGQFSQPFVDDKMAGDDDINDVAAMGGVNLAEESQRILGSTEMIGTQIRSCKEEYLVPTSLMQARIKAITSKHGMEESPPEVANIISHAVQERLKTIVEKLATIAQHRIDLIIKTDNRYEVTQDVKGQLKFLEELDRVDKKRREDSEREMLLRAAKSRSKNEDPEQAKLKAKAKEMQRAELEELRQREANLTALQAIGPRKKARLDMPGGSGDSISNGSGHNSSSGVSGRSQMALRTRLKRINLRDMICLMEQERDTSRSLMLYKSYLK